MSEEINEKLLDNPFTRNLLNTIVATIKDADKRDGFVFGKNNNHLFNEQEKYILRINKLHNTLIHTIEQISHIEVFIKRYPNKEFYQKNNISQLTYIQYHIEVLLHKIHTILELMKLLVNEIYELNIDSKDCSWKSLISRLDKKNPSLKIIDKYYKTFEKVIDFRHANTHRGIFNDSEKDEIELDYGLSIYEQHERLGIENDIEFERMFPKFMINYKLREYRKNRIRLINKFKSIIYDLELEFLTSLNDKFNEAIKNAPQQLLKPNGADA